MDRQSLIDDVLSELGGLTQGSKIMIKKLSEILTIYIKEGSGDNKVGTRKRDEVAIRPLKTFFRGWKVSNTEGRQIINGKKVREYREWRKLTVKPETVAREIDVAIRAIDYCINEMDWDLHNRFKGRKYSKADRKSVKPRVRTISESEEKQLLSHCDPLMRDIVEFLLITGMRINEVLWLTRDRVIGDMAIMNPEDHKGGYDDRRYIPEDAQAILKDQPLSHYCFSVKGQKVSYRMFWQRFDKIRQRAGLGDVRPHDLRRTCGARTRKEFDLSVAQSMLGHKSSRTTESVYAPNSADAARNAFTILSDKQETENNNNKQGVTLQ